jgi:putative sigma-54 modulation protein
VQVKVSARHGHLTDEHQAEIAKKAEGLLHFFDRITLIEVTVDLQASGHKLVEVIAYAEHKHEFVGKCEGDDLQAATIRAIDKAKVQIKHYKEKLQDHRRNPSHGGPEGIHP